MTELLILRFFMEHGGESFSIRDVSLQLSISYKVAYEIIMRLVDEGLLLLEKKGNSNICTFSFKFNDKVFQVEMMRKQDLLKNKTIQVIDSHLKDVESVFFISLLFGSYAKGNPNKQSDIDICIICDDKTVMKKIREILSVLPLSLHLVEFTSKEVLLMIDTRKDNVFKQIILSSIILTGFEDYYRLLNHGFSQSERKF